MSKCQISNDFIFYERTFFSTIINKINDNAGKVRVSLVISITCFVSYTV